MKESSQEQSTEKKGKPENRRRLVSLFMYPKLRLKYGSFYAFIGLCAVGVLNFALIFILLQMLNLTGHELEAGNDIGSRLISALQYNKWLLIGSITTLFVLFFVFAFVLANKIAGPMQPLLRHIEEIKKGNYSHRTHLRKGDELKPLMHALNDLSESFQKHK